MSISRTQLEALVLYFTELIFSFSWKGEARDVQSWLACGSPFFFEIKSTLSHGEFRHILTGWSVPQNAGTVDAELSRMILVMLDNWHKMVFNWMSPFDLFIIDIVVKDAVFPLYKLIYTCNQFSTQLLSSSTLHSTTPSYLLLSRLVHSPWKATSNLHNWQYTNYLDRCIYLILLPCCSQLGTSSAI